MQTLQLLVGLPRSGKSTYARNTSYPIVNPDFIQYALCGDSSIKGIEPLVQVYALTMVRALFLAGHQVVILDDTNVTQKQRDVWEKEKDAFWRVVVIALHTSPTICIERAKSDGREDLIPVIERMAKDWDLDEPLDVLAEEMNDSLLLLAAFEQAIDDANLPCGGSDREEVSRIKAQLIEKLKGK